MEGLLRPYPWGSRTALAELTGRPSPSPRPEAELWFGAHPEGPSSLPADSTDLLERISVDPRGGTRRRRTGGPAPVPAEAARRRPGAEPAGPPHEGAGGGGLRPRERRRAAHRLPDAELQGRQPQAGAVGRADPVRGARRFPPGGEDPGAARRAQRPCAGPLHRPAQRCRRRFRGAPGPGDHVDLPAGQQPGRPDRRGAGGVHHPAGTRGRGGGLDGRSRRGGGGPGRAAPGGRRDPGVVAAEPCRAGTG
jgi:hypothetical protein